MATTTRHLLKGSDGRMVEVFQHIAAQSGPAGALLFVHGNQGGSRLGARKLAEGCVLERFAEGLHITAAAVSQPGFGASDGPADFCGPRTQDAILAALAFLKGQAAVDPDRIVLYGISRGAVASSMVAARTSDLRAVVLSSGVYDLEPVFRTGPQGLQRAIEREAGSSAEAFSARSAFHHVEKIRAETLIMHGRLDERAPVGQAEAMADALSVAGALVELHLFECGHDIPREQSQPALRPFLERVLGARPTVH